jgi:hypothetical protein
VKATMRFETKPGEQAQVDFGHFPFITPDGQRHWYWGFVMVLAWSRLLYVEFIRHADVASFIRCHLNASSASAASRVPASTTIRQWWSWGGTPTACRTGTRRFSTSRSGSVSRRGCVGLIAPRPKGASRVASST